MTVAALSALAACGGDGVDAPTNLSYVQPPAQLIGDPIGELKPTVNGHVDTYSVAPSLPAGLTIDPKTGIISGIPHEEVDAAPYLVTAVNKGGSTSFTLSFSISEKEHTDRISAGSLALTSADPASLVNVGAPLRFEVTGAQLPGTKKGLRVFNNDTEVAPTFIAVDGNVITVSSALKDGINNIAVLASDTQQRALSLQTTLWAGSATITVSVQKPDGTIPLNAVVVARLMDQQGLAIQQTAINGQVRLENVPDRTILFSATAEDNLAATLTTVGVAGHVQLKLQGFNVPSPVSNNDFSQGTEGWQPSSSGVISIIPHVEEITPVFQENTARSKAVPLADPAYKQSLRMNRRTQTHAGKQAAGTVGPLAADPSNPDLALTTAGEGTSSVSRTFPVPVGASQVTIRYRFVTSEVPGGYFGSQYNDSFSVMARSQVTGSISSDANSMNSLGLAAFDGNGSTTWRVLTLPVAPQGDTIQVDVAVTNVADDLYDSQVVVDFVALDNLTVTSDVATACVNETVTFQATGASAESASWSGGHSPATGTGTGFPTRFTTHGNFQVTAIADGATARRTVRIKELSGAAWVQRFPTSTSLADLAPGFGANVTDFVAALRAAGASVNISATFRPLERAFLMHYAYRIANDGFNPANVPEREGIDICWVHRNAAGQVDLNAARAAAQAMVNGYGMAYPAALVSRHTQRRAVDMTVTWQGNLTIKGADGNDVTISTMPRTGAGNSSLHSVGEGYGVRKLISDAPHWSDDGH